MVAKKRKRKFPIVVITWDDSAEYDDGDTAPRHAPITMTRVGWLLKKDRKGITVATEYDEDGSWRGEHFIPKGMVRKVNKLLGD